MPDTKGIAEHGNITPEFLMSANIFFTKKLPT